jgi:uncharacterized delta-60 repeat protein
VLAGLITSGLLAGVTTATGSAAAANGPGSLDSAFGTGGTVVVNAGIDVVARDAALLASGDIVVGGDFGLARFLPNGALDKTFGSNGFAATTFRTGSNGGGWLAVQPDGKIIWVGNTGDPDGLTSDFAIARYNANGTLDASFGNGGQVTTQFFATPLQGAQEAAFTVVVQPDGKILAGGYARQGQNKAAPFQGALVRLSPRGTLDPGFGNGGQVLTSASIGPFTALGLDAAGNIVVLPVHAEFSPAGQLAATIRPAPITVSSHGNAEAFLPSGQYVSGGAVGVARHDVDIQVRRLNADGSLASSSPAFDYSGAAGLDQARDDAAAVAVQANGQAIVGGAQFLVNDLFGLARVNADGSLDAAFGSGGVLTTSIPSGFGFSTLLVQPDGKIIGVGSGQDNSGTGETQVILARYTG